MHDMYFEKSQVKAFLRQRGLPQKAVFFLDNAPFIYIVRDSLHSGSPRITSKCWDNILSRNRKFIDEAIVTLAELIKLWEDEDKDKVVTETLALPESIQ